MFFSVFFCVSTFAQGLSQKEADQVLAEFDQTFHAVVASHGGDFQPVFVLDQTDLNAYARQETQNGVELWWILIYGGFAKHPRLTVEALDFALCHELGHHLGGFPFNPGSQWMAVEGEADYFAAQACLRKLWSKQTEVNAKFRETVPVLVKEKCDNAWAVASDQDLCYRINRAAMDELTLQEQTFKSPPQYDTPDQSVVSKTMGYDHPSPQCRIDTILSATLCTTQFDFSVIPGRHEPDGQNSLKAQEASMRNSCSNSRPACWFKELN
jgi:hypothetical protein